MPSTINVVVDGADTGFSRVALVTAEAAEQSGDRMRDTVEKVGDRAGKFEGPLMGSADLLDGLGGILGINTSAATGYLRSFGDLFGGLSTILPAVAVIQPVWTAIGAFAAARREPRARQTAVYRVHGPAGVSGVGARPGSPHPRRHLGRHQPAGTAAAPAGLDV